LRNIYLNWNPHFSSYLSCNLGAGLNLFEPLFFDFKNVDNSWAWWFTPIIPVLGRLRQKDCKFEARS
jgi:hypothetical protein